MGKFGRALGAGLSSLGGELFKMDASDQERERYNEQLRMQQEKHDSNLSAALMRNKQLTLQNSLKKIELNTKQLTNLFVQSEGNPEILSPAISNLGHGYAEEYDPVASAAATKANGGKQMYVTHNGTYKTKANGVDLETDPITGKKIFEQLEGPAGTSIRTPAEYNQHFAEVVNPDKYLSRVTANQTEKEKRAAARIQYEEKRRSADIESRTPAGLAKQKKLETQQKSAEMDIKLKQKALNAPPEAAKKTPTVTNIEGKSVQLSRQEYDAATASMKIYSEENPEWGVASPDQAYRINQMKDTKALREDFAKHVAKAADSEDYAKKMLRVLPEQLGLPREFIEDAIAKAIEYTDRPIPVKEKKSGFMKWWSDFLEPTQQPVKGYEKE